MYMSVNFPHVNLNKLLNICDFKETTILYTKYTYTMGTHMHIILLVCFIFVDIAVL